jgi:hypothetical protein
MNIFEKFNMLLVESKAEESDIPIHPEMETKEQGEMAAAEKILKLFQKLKMSSGSSKEEIKDERPEIPDDMIDPMMKERPKSSKDKSFEKNKLAGWDEDSEEKVKKEVDVDSGDDEEDEFDDFDYRDNTFGDEEDDDDFSEDDDDERSEDEKLKDAIDDAIDSLGDGDASGDDFDDDDSGANWGDDGDDEQQGDGQQGGNSGDDSQSGKMSGGQMDGEQQSGGKQDGQQGESNPNSSDSGSQSSTKDGGGRETISQKQKRLNELKKSLESDSIEDFDEKIQDVKNSTNAPEDNTIGGHIETPSDETFKEDMKKGGFNDETIDEMTQKKNTDTNSEYSEEEMEKLTKSVVDGLEKACEKKGGSALASTIVKNSLKRKLNNDEWKEMLKLFLKAKSTNAGNMSTSNKGIKWGHKNHLWRDAVLPTDGPSKGTIQTINCFVDFSGSVDRDLVFVFLGKVIDMCMELKYTNVNVYGFGERITLPRVLNKKAFKDGVKVALSQTWDFIKSQQPGMGTENFADVAEEINKIKRKDRNAVFLIFGDGRWEDRTVGPKALKYNIINEKYLKDICVLAYYQYPNDKTFAGVMNELREIVGIKHIITSKATSIYIEK